ncbi:MAG: type III restriction endonuclease subunit R, partial [Cetobacterium sp.]
SRKPIDVIASTNPILIIDEPQTVEGKGDTKTKDQIKKFKPFFTLRYSATHRKEGIFNMVYRLDSMDAYNQKLVKRIAVKGMSQIGTTATNSYVYLEDIQVYKDKSPMAHIGFERKSASSGATKIVKLLSEKDNLYSQSKELQEYKDRYFITTIDADKNIVSFGNGLTLSPGDVVGSVNFEVLRRLQIRETIKSHIEREQELYLKGIKVLSLFFIDEVANYREYDDAGNEKNGLYGEMFEQEYAALIEEMSSDFDSKYRTYIESMPVSSVHRGYFSVDKKGRSINSAVGKRDKEGISDDVSAYDLIMKNKTLLLDLRNNVRFIFSHSALREGWDNPNVFQICTLNETTSEMKKRQEIGRGLRIAVNQHGERVRGFEVNTLTVMANESYEQFVENLQKEMETEEGIKFGHVESHLFANIMLPPRFVGDENYLGHEKSEDIFKYLVEYDYIDEVTGKATDKLKKDILDNRVEIPEEYHDLKNEIIGRLKTTAGKLIIKNADMKVPVKIRKGVYLSPEFRELWDRVKYKTTYSVDFDEDKLIEKCREELKDYIYIPEPRVIYSKERLEINSGGIKTSEATVQEEYVAYDQGYALPDILTYLQNETNLTRDAIVKILTGSKTLESFKKDPQKYMEQSSEIIRNVMSSFIVDGIKYEKIGDFEYYKQELFETEDLFGYLRDELHKTGNMIVSEKSPYDHVVFDSTTIESPFAEELEKSDNVKVYAKLPGWFKIETPLGTYNPDWAILYNESGANGFEKLYFVVETKGSHFMNDLREVEKNKIHCGKEHFKALDNSIKFRVASSFDALNKS